MRIRVVSDLHLEFGAGFPLTQGDEDLLVVAGDLSNDPDQAREWLEAYGGEVVVCLGNHEYYGDRTMDETDELWSGLASERVHVLQDTSIVVGGLRFYGATMWTDLAGDEREIEWGMADFRYIPDISVWEVRRRHERSRQILAQCLGTSPEPVVVVTHHLPTWDSIAPQYAGSDLNAAFASTDLGDLVGQARLWIHGHTHASVDIEVSGTRVVCNPHGYPSSPPDPPENPDFDPDLVVQCLSTF